MKQVTDAAKAANQLLTDSLTAQGSALMSLVSSYDGSATATHNLATATTAYQSTLVQLLAQIQQVQAPVHSMFSDTIRVDDAADAG